MWNKCLAACMFLGALGGLLKPILAQQDYILPVLRDGIFVPGFLGALLIGIVAGGLYWLLYGPDLDAIPNRTRQQLSIAVAGGFFVGLGGAGWITAESNGYLLKNTAKAAAYADPQLIKTIETGHPAAALQEAKAAATFAVGNPEAGKGNG